MATETINFGESMKSIKLTGVTEGTYFVRIIIGDEEKTQNLFITY